MLSKTIKYTDFNGTEREETFYFNLTQAELMEMQMSVSGGFSETLQKIVETKDLPQLMTTFKEIIKKSYGEKSPDGRYFLKTDNEGHLLFNKFEQSAAYSVLFTELATNDEAASEFVSGVIPAEAATKIAVSGENAITQTK